MGREQDLVQALRAELAAIEPARACCRLAEIDGLGDAARGRARSPVVARLAVRLAGGRPHGGTAAAWAWGPAAEHCRLAWLRGRFLATGSLSLGPTSSHLEFVVPTDEASTLADRLAAMGLPAGWRERRGRGVVTWKGREPILTFLRRVGASASVLELESRAVDRLLHGHLNRVLNAESGNARRSVAAAARQVAAIEALEAAGELGHLAALERGVARIRREDPTGTLSELAQALGASRARVQRALERIEQRAAAVG